jgi:hypothetical protein
MSLVLLCQLDLRQLLRFLFVPCEIIKKFLHILNRKLMPKLREYKTCYRVHYGPLVFIFQTLVDMRCNSDVALISVSSALSSGFMD